VLPLRNKSWGQSLAQTAIKQAKLGDLGEARNSPGSIGKVEESKPLMS